LSARAIAVACIAHCGTSSEHPSADDVAAVADAVVDVAVGFVIVTVAEGKGLGVVASVDPGWRLWRGGRWGFQRRPGGASMI